MSFSKIGAIKLVVSGIVGMGASRIAGQIIKNNVTAPTNLLEKVALMAGTWAIGGIIAERSRKHTDDAIDQVVGIVKKVQEGVQTDIKLNRINKDTSTFEDEGLNAEDFEKNVAGKWVRVKKIDQPKPDVEFKDGDIIITKDGVKTRVKEVDNGLWAIVVDEG